MEIVTSKIKYLESKNHFPFFLAFFRLFLSFHIIKKIYLFWGSQSIYFGEHSFLNIQKGGLIQMLGIPVDLIAENSNVFLSTIIVTAILFLFGIGRNITVLLLFFEVKVFQQMTYIHLNGGDNLLIFVLMYFVFADSFHYFSFNKAKKTGKTRNLISNLATYSIMIHLCLVYFVTAMHKIHADAWFNGVATYYVLNVERFSSPLSTYIVNNGFLVTITTYMTILIELLFPILIWFKKCRYPLLILGTLMHLGIYFTMMIFDFQIFFIALYGFFIPDHKLRNLFTKISMYIQTFHNHLNSKIQKVKLSN